MRASTSYLAPALFLLAAGCGSNEPGNATNQTAAQASAAAEPAANAATVPPAPNADRVLTAEGYGPLRIGMTLAEVTAALGPDSDPEAVGGPEPEMCDQFRPARAPEGLLVMMEDGRLTRITLMSGSEIQTDKGLRVGATAAQVRAAYGPAIRSGHHKYQDPPAEYLTAWTRGGAGDEEAAPPDSRGIRYEVDQEGKVALIHAGGPSIQYVEGCL